MKTHRGSRHPHPAKRHFLALAAALVIVAILLVVTHLAGEAPLRSGAPQGESPQDNAHTVLTVVSTPPTLPPAPSRVQPSQEQWETLLPRLEAAVAAAPTDLNLKRKLALAYYNLGLFEQAAALYIEMLAVKEDAVLRNRLGNTLRDLGDPKAAEQAYRQAIADDPSLPQPYCNLAELLWRQGKDSEALAILKKGLEAVPAENRSLLEQAYQIIQTYQK